MQKLCVKCNTMKSVDEFYFHVQRSGKSYPHSYCKRCSSRGATESCTRLRRTNTKSRLVAFKDGAKRRNLSVEVSDNFLCEMFQSSCHFCGLAPSNELNGIDRLNSELDYIGGNVVACCANCNFAKRSLPVTEFLNLIKRIAIHQGWIAEENYGKR